MAGLAGWVLIALVLIPALFVVAGRNLVRGVLWLGVVLLATAGAYVLLDAPFVAAVQVLLYAGGVVILLIFGVMLTRRHEGLTAQALRGSPFRGILVAAPMFGTLVYATWISRDALPSRPVPPGAGEIAIAEVGRAIVTDYVLAFEVLSVLLLAAMIGAIVIARKRDAGTEEEHPTPRAAATLPKETA